MLGTQNEEGHGYCLSWLSYQASVVVVGLEPHCTAQVGFELMTFLPQLF